MEGKFVYALAQDPRNPNVWLASIRDDGSSGIAISTDGGETWDIDNLKAESSAQILDLIPKIEGDSTFFFAARANSPRGFLFSSNYFANFYELQELTVSSRDLDVSPIDSSLMFLAGDKLHAGGVFRSRDNGKTWLKDESGLENLRVQCVAASAYDPSIVVCGADSLTASGSVGKGIYVSLDTGKTWRLAAAAGAKVYQIARSETNPRYLAAACGEDGVWISGSWGTGWEKFSDGLPDSASVRRVAFPRYSVSDSEVVVFAGTFMSGLYKSEPIKTEVAENFPTKKSPLSELKVFPTVVANVAKIKFAVAKRVRASLELTDEKGSLVKKISSAYFEPGVREVELNVKNLPAGVYFVLLKSDSSLLTAKIIVSK